MRKTSFFLLCTFFIVFSAVVLIVFKDNGENERFDDGKTVYLELWHIDTFEGGTGSRKAFLENAVKNFNASGNIKIIVKQQTVLSCEENFSKCIYPDMISYGNGLNLPFERLYTLDKFNSYALVWCCGGYVLIERADEKIDGVILSEQKNTVCLLAYHLSNLDLPVFSQEKSTSAIYSFYKNKQKALLGTQRDLYRLQNKDLNIKVTVLDGYNDLYQYISVLSDEKENAVYSTYFVNYLLSDKVQSDLYKIGMCSEKNQNTDSPLKCYNGVEYSFRTQELINIEQIQTLKNLSENFYENAESIKNALKRLK